MEIQAKVLSLDAKSKWKPTITEMTTSVKKFGYHPLQKDDLENVVRPTAEGVYVTPLCNAAGEVTGYVLCEITKKGHNFRTGEASLGVLWPNRTRWLYNWTCPST